MTSKTLTTGAHNEGLQKPGLSALRFRLIGENQQGTIQIGKRSYPLRITEMNARCFHAVMDFKTSSRISTGGQARLKVMDKDCKIVVCKKKITGDGTVSLVFEQIDDAFRPAGTKRGWFGSKPDSQVSLSGGDSLLPILMVVAAFITILILPSFGGRWGTAQRISDFVEWTWDAVTSSMKKG